MKQYQLELAPSAIEQAATVRRWWIANRPAAPELFMDELSAALTLLGDVPRIGHPYEDAGIPGMRRLLLPRTRFHVYYVVHDAPLLVRVHGLWHAARGARPPLPQAGE